MKLSGRYDFYIKDKLVHTVHNIVCTPVYDFILNSLNGDTATGVDLNYFAFGESTTAVTESDVALESEQFRKAVTSKSWTGKQFIAFCQLGTDEANFTITEIGVFSNATSTTDSGTLLSHALSDITKNSNIVYNIKYTLTLEEN